MVILMSLRCCIIDNIILLLLDLLRQILQSTSGRGSILVTTCILRNLHRHLVRGILLLLRLRDHRVREPVVLRYRLREIAERVRPPLRFVPRREVLHRVYGR